MQSSYCMYWHDSMEPDVEKGLQTDSKEIFNNGCYNIERIVMHWWNFQYSVVPGNIRTTPMERICRMTPSPLVCGKLFPPPPPVYPTSPLEFPKFSHNPWKYCYLLLKWTASTVVLFTRMPNFMSFVYFLLNSITDITGNSLFEFLMHSSQKQILWVSHVFWLSAKFCYRLANSLCLQFTKKLFKKFLVTRTGCIILSHDISAIWIQKHPTHMLLEQHQMLPGNI